MFEFAQTNLQLYRQMEQLGYSAENRERVVRAYRFLVPSFSGLYRGSEKPFIAHLVGTASILVAYRAPIELVLAGLLHAVFMAGDFGFQSGTRQTARKRRRIRELAGAEVEAIIVAYDAMPWDADAINTYRTEFEQQPAPARAAVLLQLANCLEDLTDSGVAYSGKSKFEQFVAPGMQEALKALAGTHGWPGFSSRLEQALAELNEVVRRGLSPVDPAKAVVESRLVLPPSSRRKLLPVASGWIVRRLRRAMAGLRSR